MSDIAIRFDGIMLAASLILAAAIYLLIALCAGAVWLRTGRRNRARQVARTSALFGVLYLAAVAVLVVHLNSASTPVSGPDWLDWLSLPSVVLFVIGCVVIARRQPAPH